ncbi:selenocysteine-specific translation elongation factor [Nonomuraea longispora]|uniref:Selenocysteine-specific translation elongation factor n=1 Tax=Nonomuraea longispora TaxID=1848320 RepID=A0A4R4MNC8_9ACTN|nr:SelB C-terminal domain-containing protein [Nonomuraea longispora]TDB95489.1 selenocysteine-specific translation elongation factor [Nonomuraea longispora]
MHVVATAGHVDHGKSTLVRALTGMEPDRLDEERRRGLTIELGYAWTALPSGERLAFVDVPGHERFLATMLAGVGPVPAVMFVVAADEGWMPQSEEHLVALEALGVRHCLLVVTRSDLAGPAAAVEQAGARLDAAGIGGVEAVTVSGRTGQGLPELRQALDRLVAGLPRPDPAAEVRLWIDRAFSVTGSGTVITGTLPAGTVSVGDELLLAGEPVRVRGLESLKEPRDTVSGVARVAVNLRGHDVPDRGQALVTPGGWTYTDLIDVRVSLVGALRHESAGLPRRLTVHVGSAAVAAEARRLGGRVVRLRLTRPVPLHLGDVLLLRDPGRDRSEVRVLAGASVLDVRPPALGRRGAAGRRAALLETAPLETAPLETALQGGDLPETAAPGTAYALRLHRLLRAADLRAMGVPPDVPGTSGEWYADPDHWKELGRRLAEEARRYAAGHPLEPAMPVEAARHRLGLPDRRLVTSLVRPPLALHGGRIVAGPAGLPEPVARAVERLRRDLAARPFQAPDAGRLAELGLGPRELAAAERAGSLLRVAEGIVLLPGADARAAAVLSRLPQPFTVSQARHALGTTRRVVVPLLEHLDRAGLTERLDEVHRRCRPPARGR